MQRQKIELYTERTFSRKLSDTFDFLSENGKTLFKFLAYLLLPVCAVQAVGINTYMGSIFTLGGNIDAMDHEDLVTFFIGYGALMLAVLVGTTLCSSLIYTLVRVYNEREERLEGITLSELRPMLLSGAWKTVKMGFFIIVMATVIITLMTIIGAAAGVAAGGGLSVFLLVIGFIALFACFIPLALTLPIYIIEEDAKLWPSLTKALRLGFKTWGGIFGVLFIVGFIANFIQGVASIPWYIMIMIKAVLTAGDSASTMTSSPLYSFGTYLFGVVQSFGMYVGYTIMHVAIAMLYGHAAEKVDGVSVERDVDNFEQMGDENEDDDLALFDSPKP